MAALLRRHQWKYFAFMEKLARHTGKTRRALMISVAARIRFMYPTLTAQTLPKSIAALVEITKAL